MDDWFNMVHASFLYDECNLSRRVVLDINICVKNFNPTDHSWIDYRIYFVNIAKKAQWSDNTKCVKLMAALDAGMFGVTDGLGDNFTFDQIDNQN